MATSLPINAVTTAFGAPLIIWLIMRRNFSEEFLILLAMDGKDKMTAANFPAIHAEELELGYRSAQGLNLLASGVSFDLHRGGTYLPDGTQWGR